MGSYRQHLEEHMEEHPCWWLTLIYSCSKSTWSIYGWWCHAFHSPLSHVDVFHNQGFVEGLCEPSQSQVCMEWDRAPIPQGCVEIRSCSYLHEEATTYLSHLQKSPHFSQFHIFECSSSMHIIILLDKRRLWVKPHKSRWEWAEILILSWMAIFNLVPCHMCLGSSTEIIHPSSKLKTARRRSIFSLFCRWTV